MEQSQRSNNVAVEGAKIMSSKEECALGMEQSQRSNNVAVEGAKIESSKEEFARGMEHIAILGRVKCIRSIMQIRT